MKDKVRVLTLFGLAILMIVAVWSANISAQSTEFTYQGRLLDNSLPPSANYDFEFELWDSLANGTQMGTKQTVVGVPVANGIFTVRLDFGTQFSGPPRFLQIAIRVSGVGSYTTLAPRQPFTSVPYSMRSISSTRSDSLSVACNPCVSDAQISGIAGNKVTGAVANAIDATNAVNVTGVVPIENGGTGSSSQNFVDLTSAQTIGGAKAFSVKPTGVISVNTFAGPVANVPGGSSSYVYVGPTTNVLITSTSRITGSAFASIGTTSGTSVLVDVGMCYTSGGVITNFSAINYVSTTISQPRQPVSASASTVLGSAGAYTVGMCVRNGSLVTLSNNDYVNGWVMVTAN